MMGQIVTLVPDQWPLSSLNTFLARYFRRTLHASHEAMILKNLSAGQNMAVRFLHVIAYIYPHSFVIMKLRSANILGRFFENLATSSKNLIPKRKRKKPNSEVLERREW